MRQPVPARWITVPVLVPVGDGDGPARAEVGGLLDDTAALAAHVADLEPSPAQSPASRRLAWRTISDAVHKAALLLAVPTGVDPYPASAQLPVGTVIATTDRVWIRGPDRTDTAPEHQHAKHVWQPGNYSHQQIDGFRHRNQARILRIGTGR
jgi:hypothetical protein